MVRPGQRERVQRAQRGDAGEDGAGLAGGEHQCGKRGTSGGFIMVA